ncbi:hypothetical protein [Paraburkholderia sp. BL6669N2]|uniref:hypothetical protein n=1 Tax=Paraburkholderia sp. BL6669N2 TaxID=1938807 RepID=UPI0011C04B6E|nr:hypothetical protein [Paraburkholderia sp. BL6669N2]
MAGVELGTIADFKSQSGDCQPGTGVWIAAIAMNHKLNANLLRRSVEQTEGKLRALLTGDKVMVRFATTPAFVPPALETGNIQPSTGRPPD